MDTLTELKLGDELVVCVLPADILENNPGVFCKGKRVVVSWGGRLHTAIVVDLRRNSGDDRIFIHGKIIGLDNGRLKHDD